MKLTVLNVAYPCAEVGADAVGGAEQILHLLDAGLVARGHRSIVVACDGSTVAGELITTGRPPQTIEDDALRRVQVRHRRAIERVLDGTPVDVVHMHGVDFYKYLPRRDVPTLATLHLPLSWYPTDVFRLRRPATHLHCVSESQHSTAPKGAKLLAPVANGVRTEGLPHRHGKRRFALALGRICPEKGFHLAVDAARGADVPLIIGGRVYPYPQHEAYFREELAPRLDALRRFVGPLALERKQRLMSAARAVLIPSLAWETSSLVAMEALACGTPVIAFPKGALSEIIDHGKTGFLVDGVPEMAEALEAAATLDPLDCVAAARTKFSARRMVSRYIALYGELAGRSVESGEAVCDER